MTSRSTASWDPALLPVLSALTVAILPTLTRLPWVILAIVLATIGYAAVGKKREWPRPGTGLRRLMTLAAIGTVWVTYGRLIGQDAGVALYALMIVLKTYEMHTERDRMVAMMMIYFLSAIILFFDKSMTVGVYTLAAVAATTAVIAHLNAPSASWKHQFRLSGLLLLQAIPIMVILFVLFPRLQSSLWGVQGSAAGVTGFSDTLAPGDVTTLVRDTRVAFRVQFDSPLPPPDRRYWRGIVFNDFDGRRWQRGAAPPPLRQPVSGSDDVVYTVTLEPHHRQWLFALDLPASIPRYARMGSDYTLTTYRSVRDRRQYRMRSVTRYRTGPISTAQTDRLTEIRPGETTRRAQALAREWAAAHPGKPQRVDAALSWFRENDFRYTLNPPAAEPFTIDTFLFDTRSGYCEHYASAFAVLMRFAGIPARIVGGYVGGEINPYGNYVIVRQSDAHAWVEVWLAERGWVRIDPTAAVSPTRVSQGLQQALPPEEMATIDWVLRLGPAGDFIRNIQLSWDAVNLKWGQWVAGYSYGRQREVLSRLGFRLDSLWDRITSLLWGIGGIGLLLLVYAVSLHVARGPKTDPVAREYRRFCRRLAASGIRRRPDQGPTDFAADVIRRYPDLAPDVNAITRMYVRLRYGPRPLPDGLENAFRKSIRRFRAPAKPKP